MHTDLYVVTLVHKYEFALYLTVLVLDNPYVEFTVNCAGRELFSPHLILIAVKMYISQGSC